jgi:hypothetical protein
MGDDLSSRGANMSEVSYKVEGTSPNRIFKLQFFNTSLKSSAPLINDSINIQVWIYETSNIIEFRYGAGTVGVDDWSDAGPFTALLNPVNPTPPTSFMFIEGSTTNPTVNTNDANNATSLMGLPASGTIYRFTPSQFKSGINSTSVKINVIQNKISLPANVEVKQINIINMNGQVVQTGANAESIDLSSLPHGVYMVNVQTNDGVLTSKLIL